MDVLMNSLRSVLLAASVLGAATCSDSSGLASAASNADSLTMTCAQVQDYINEHGQTLLTTGKESGNYSFDYAECGGTVPGYACTGTRLIAMSDGGATIGSDVLASKAAADMNWQQPHWTTSRSSHAF
jgi:hypothetical protein